MTVAHNNLIVSITMNEDVAMTSVYHEPEDDCMYEDQKRLRREKYWRVGFVLIMVCVVLVFVSQMVVLGYIFLQATKMLPKFNSIIDKIEFITPNATNIVLTTDALTPTLNHTVMQIDPLFHLANKTMIDFDITLRVFQDLLKEIDTQYLPDLAKMMKTVNDYLPDLVNILKKFFPHITIITMDSLNNTIPML